MKSSFVFILVLISHFLFAQNISNKLDLSFLAGYLTPMGNKMTTIGGTEFSNLFANSSGKKCYQLKAIYNQNAFGLGLNLEMSSLKTSSLDDLSLIGFSPVFSFNKNILIDPMSISFNMMPTIYLYETNLPTGEIVVNNKSSINIQRINQIVPGLKMSLGLKLDLYKGVALGFEYGGAILKDNHRLTAEKSIFYNYLQLGLTARLFYNKRYYLQYE